MKSLRIVITDLNMGGTEKHLLQVLPLISQKGWAIKVISLKKTTDNYLISALKDSGIEVQAGRTEFLRGPRVLNKLFYCVKSLIRLIKEFRTQRNTITHFFLPEAYLLGMCAACLTRIPMTIMSRRSSNRYQRKYPILGWLEKKFHRRVHFILGNSEAIIKELVEQEGVSRQKLKLIYNGIDTALYEKSYSSVRTCLGIEKHELVFIAVANLFPYKGHRDILKALALIYNELPAWRLLCVGRDEGQLKALKILAQELNLTSRVQWLGQRIDIPELLTASDIALQASHEEGFANAILEAMASGLPVIATHVGGNREAVLDGETGLIVPSQNPAALSRAILALASDKLLIQKMGLAGRERVNQFFSLKRCAMDYAQFYETLHTLSQKKNLCVV